MITVEEWTTIRTLHAKGQSQRSIARLLNISRNTVKRALQGDHVPKYQRAKTSDSQLEPFREQIEQMLFVDQFIGSRIFNELKKLGFQGQKSAFYDYLSKIKTSKQLSKISKPYHTAPGEQAQFDWSVYTVRIGDTLTKVFVFNTILGFSRKRKYVASLSDDQGSVFCAIEEALAHFTGAPKEILVDNARQMVTNAAPEFFEWNENFLQFCGYYRMTPRHCKIRTAKTKGKVENPFYYLEQHFIKGGRFTDFDDFENQLSHFNEQVNQKIHSNLKVAPDEKFVEEKPYLTALPQQPYVGIKETFRKVNWDCLISFEGSKYSVPFLYAGKSVWVRKVKGFKIKIFSQKGVLIAEHFISKTKGQTIINDGHYEGLYTFQPKTLAFLKQQFQQFFPNHTLFLEKLLASKRLSAARHLSRIIHMKHYYDAADLNRAFEKCLQWNNYSADVFIAMLRNNAEIRHQPCLFKKQQQTNHDEPDLKRQLKYYEQLY
jgi:transposase